jgi:hypothetical protein
MWVRLSLWGLHTYHEMGWDEMRWDEMRWDEMRWDEMRWGEILIIWVELTWETSHKVHTLRSVHNWSNYKTRTHGCSDAQSWTQNLPLLMLANIHGIHHQSINHWTDMILYTHFYIHNSFLSVSKWGQCLIHHLVHMDYMAVSWLWFVHETFHDSFFWIILRILCMGSYTVSWYIMGDNKSAINSVKHDSYTRHSSWFHQG